MTLAELDALLAEAADPDDALRAVVRLLSKAPGVSWAAIAFVENGELALGPSAGAPDPGRRTLVTLCHKGQNVGELRVDGDADFAFLEAVAERLSSLVLVGWDTRGEAWEP